MVLIIRLFCFLLIVHTPSSKRTGLLFPYTTHFRSYTPVMTVAAVILSATTEGAIADTLGQPRVRRLADLAWSGGALPIVVLAPDQDGAVAQALARSEEHTSELQSLMRISYAVFCLNKKINSLKRKTIIYTDTM